MYLMAHYLNLLLLIYSHPGTSRIFDCSHVFLLPGRHAGEGGDVDEILQGLVDEKRSKPSQDRFNCDSSFDIFHLEDE